MIVPYSTDAPIYHFPKATLGLIAANVAAYLAWSYLPPSAAEPFAMRLGEGLHPLQWLTHNFLHADFLHLGFNLVFLWAYGIVVEGKVGWLPFLLIYLGIGTVQGAAIQAAYLHAAEPSCVLGASGVVFGLMAIGMVWAPANELSCFYLFFAGLRIVSGTFEWPIYAFAMLQLGLEGASVLLAFLVRGDPMSSGLLHISGALWGLLAGALLVKLRLVDCEGWDAFSLWRKRRALGKAWRAREARLDRNRRDEKRSKSRRSGEGRPAVSPEERAAKRLAKLHRAIELGDAMSAQAAYKTWMDATASRPPREALLGVVKALHAQGLREVSIPPMRALCRLYPEKSEKVRLKLASLLLQSERPTEASRHLRQIPPGSLDDALERFRRRLLEDAGRMIEEGVLELEEEP